MGRELTCRFRLVARGSGQTAARMPCEPACGQLVGVKADIERIRAIYRSVPGMS